MSECDTESQAHSRCHTHDVRRFCRWTAVACSWLTLVLLLLLLLYVCCCYLPAADACCCHLSRQLAAASALGGEQEGPHRNFWRRLFGRGRPELLPNKVLESAIFKDACERRKGARLCRSVRRISESCCTSATPDNRTNSNRLDFRRNFLSFLTRQPNPTRNPIKCLTAAASTEAVLSPSIAASHRHRTRRHVPTASAHPRIQPKRA